MAAIVRKVIFLTSFIGAGSVSVALALERLPTEIVAGMSSTSSVLGRGPSGEGVDMTRMHVSPGLHIVRLDESPFVGPVAEQIRNEIAEQKAKGVRMVPKGGVPDMRRVARGAGNVVDSFSFLDRSFRSTEDIRPHLQYAPASLKGTLLEALPLIEATTAGGINEGKWSGVTRSWEVAGLGRVQLDESEYRETGGAITLVKEWLNADVNGHPATISTLRDESGLTKVSLGWVTDSTVFRLDLQPVDANALQANQDALLAMARGLGVVDTD